ncbi:MAG: hypothetical protein ABFS45_26210 [Pseudomonadota bacterium]
MDNRHINPHAVLFPITSLIILVFLVSQVAVIIIPVMFYYWPFMDYPMYSGVRYENEMVNDNYVLVGIKFDAQEQNVTHKELGLSFFQFNDWLVPRLLKNEKDQTIRPYLDQLRAMNNHAFQRIRIQAKPVLISRSGISEAPMQVFKVIDLHLQE